MKSISKKSNRGLTLVELMIALGIAAVIGLLFIQLNLGTARTMFDSRGKLENTRDVRVFTLELSRAAKGAHFFYVYPDGASAPTRSRRVAGGQSGDLVVFVFLQPESLAIPNSDIHITRLVAYLREAQPGEAGPVVRIDRNFPIASGSGRHWSRDPNVVVNTVEDLLAPMLQSAPRREIVELSEGFADGRLFRNYRNRSVVVNGEILHGNDARRVTNTYNFTVTPRG